MSTSKKADTGQPGPRSRNGPDDAESRGAVVPRWWLNAVAALIIVPWLVVWALYSRGASDPDAGPTAAGADGPVTSSAPGPWGHLTYVPIAISPPLEYVSIDWGPIEPPMWHFPGASPEAVESVLTAAGLSPGDAARLRATARIDPRMSGVVITPDAALVRAMDPQVRARIYALLAKSPRNLDQAHSFRYFAASPDLWLGFSPISQRTRALVDPLIYRHGEYLHFADLELVRTDISDAEELRRLAKALLRTATLKVDLVVDDPDAVDELAAYWGRGGRRTDIRPLLESVAGIPSAHSIDIVHLLPAFAREHLYRYPKLSAGDLERPVIANCLWSSLNFFTPRPDDRFLDVTYALERLKNDYYIVEHGFELGDIVAMLDGDGDLFHVAVYLADDLVFTKNGTSPMAPWAILPMALLTGYYQVRAEQPRLIYHRKNGF
jgi:hypothetical protein